MTRRSRPSTRAAARPAREAAAPPSALTEPLHPWDRAAHLRVVRRAELWQEDCELEAGVNFFVLALEQLGATTHWSCEGHPNGFYLVAEMPYALAQQISGAGFLTVALGKRMGEFRLSYSLPPESMAAHRQTLRWTAEAWVRVLGIDVNRFALAPRVTVLPGFHPASQHDPVAAPAERRRSTAPRSARRSGS